MNDYKDIGSLHWSSGRVTDTKEFGGELIYFTSRRDGKRHVFKLRERTPDGEWIYAEVEDSSIRDIRIVDGDPAVLRYDQVELV